MSSRRSLGLAKRRAAAGLALGLSLAAVALAAVVVVREFPRGLIVLACVAFAGAAAWYGLVHRGPARGVGLVAAGLASIAALAIGVTGGSVLENLLVVAGVVASTAAAGTAFRIHVPLTPVPRPRRAVLFYNPRSGGGKAERFALSREAQARDIKPIELRSGTDLAVLAEHAVAEGADALAMAGGDGSQAIIAAAAAEHSLPYACVPAGTRNHFALDLGVDRDDVVGALDAFIDGGERRVDLAEVNGRVFVNNVSLGLYAEAVQKSGYRDAKLRTLLDTAPEVLGEGASPSQLTWQGPGGREGHSTVAILISNNRYRLGRPVGSGTRPRIDDGLLGITVLDAPSGRGKRGPFQRPWHEWSAQSFEVEADGPVPAGIDGEAVVLEPPLRFRILPGVLRARIAREHPGASPSAITPDGAWASFRALSRIAAGRDPRTPGRP